MYVIDVVVNIVCPFSTFVYKLLFSGNPVCVLVICFIAVRYYSHEGFAKKYMWQSKLLSLFMLVHLSHFTNAKGDISFSQVSCTEDEITFLEDQVADACGLIDRTARYLQFPQYKTSPLSNLTLHARSIPPLPNFNSGYMRRLFGAPSNRVGGPQDTTYYPYLSHTQWVYSRGRTDTPDEKEMSGFDSIELEGQATDYEDVVSGLTESVVVLMVRCFIDQNFRLYTARPYNLARRKRP